METLVHANKIEEIRVLLGFEGAFAVDREGRGGGLAMIWRSAKTCVVLGYSQNHIDVVVNEEDGRKWLLSGFYGLPERNRRRESWSLLRSLRALSPMSWCCMGDFNDLLQVSDKKGIIDHPAWLFTGFRDVVSDCGLIDLPLHGYGFTWERGRGTDRWVEERLDRALVSQEWLLMFPGARLTNLIAEVSDHSPILLETHVGFFDRKKRHFRFENSWLLEEGFEEVVKRSWDGSHRLDMVTRLDLCGKEMAGWSRQLNRRFKTDIEACKSAITRLRRSSRLGDVAELQEQKVLLGKLLLQEECYWKQRAKLFWLSEGDANTKYFHSLASTRRRGNRISKLQDDRGLWATDRDSITTVVVNYFKNIFAASVNRDDEVIKCVRPRVSSCDNEGLVAPFRLEEFRCAVFQMHPDKAPGPDGLNPAFFQKFWPFIGNDVFIACVSWLRQKRFPVGLNNTIISLIPKCESPTSMKELRPIALCNVLYKIIAKVLANRLKGILPSLISEYQSAFVPGRSITDNVLVAFELIHYMKRKTTGRRGNVALKIDISKAYDRMSWSFLENMMFRLGFSTEWIQWVMLCVSTVSYQPSLNGELLDSITPGRGLRQGDPLSPYLFILCAEGLSALIQEEERRGNIHGCQVCKRAPSVSHLFFADDSFFFFRATEFESQNLRRVFHVYEEASGQAINFQKSGIFFSANVQASLKANISNQLGVFESLNTGRYLGLPSLIGRHKKMVFSFLKERLWKRIQGWQGRLLSRAGKEVLIKSIAQAIPSYCMSSFLLPKSLCEELERMMNSFWWGSKKDGSRGINWMCWGRLSRRKECGGLSFRNLHAFNLAMLGKQGWNLVFQPNALVNKIFKAKYFARCDFFQAPLGHCPSYTWRSVWSSRSLLEEGCRWKIGDGSTINVWTDSWLKEADNRRLQTPVVQGLEDLKVCDLIIPGGRSWDVEMIEDIFNPRDIPAILSIVLTGSCTADSRVWHFNKNGIYTVKSGYRVAMKLFQEEGDESADVPWENFWKLQLPPKIKNFLWRACCECLPTRNNLLKRGVPVMDECALCGGVGESVVHVLLQCPFASQCWDATGERFNLMNTSDFKAWFFANVFGGSDSRQNVLCAVLWSIWSQRNSLLWQGKIRQPAHVVRQGLEFLADWKAARLNKGCLQNQSNQSAPVVRWQKPLQGRLKCNVDAALFDDRRLMGVGVVVRDDLGGFVRCMSKTIVGFFTVMEAEVIGLREALSWIRSWQGSNLDVEMDAKSVVDAFNSNGMDISEFGVILNECRVLCCQVEGSSVSFVRRQANKAAHILARVACMHENPSYWIVPPPFIVEQLRSDVLLAD